MSPTEGRPRCHQDPWSRLRELSDQEECLLLLEVAGLNKPWTLTLPASVARLLSSENRPRDDFWREQHAPVSSEFVNLLQVATNRHQRRRDGFVPLVEPQYTCRRRDSEQLWVHVAIGSENPEEAVRRIAHLSGGVEHGGCRSCPQNQSVVKEPGFAFVLHCYHFAHIQHRRIPPQRWRAIALHLGFQRRPKSRIVHT